MATQNQKQRLLCVMHRTQLDPPSTTPPPPLGDQLHTGRVSASCRRCRRRPQLSGRAYRPSRLAGTARVPHHQHCRGVGCDGAERRRTGPRAVIQIRRTRGRCGEMVDTDLAPFLFIITPRHCCSLVNGSAKDFGSDHDTCAHKMDAVQQIEADKFI